MENSVQENTVHVTPSATAIERRGGDLHETRTGSVAIRPAIDVLESADQIRVVADVPGVAAADADVQVEMPHLRVSALRRLPDGSRVEYRAALRLPDTIDAESLTAGLRHGVLEIAMNKHPRARSRRIEVRNA